MADNGANKNGRGGVSGMPGQEPDPRPLAKRFYKDVATELLAEGHGVVLDGRAVRTPGKRRLVLPTAALAAVVAAEWQAQVEVIDPAEMPLTKIANTAIDGVADKLADVRSEIVGYAGNDLIGYRAEHPQLLVERQAQSWDPVLAWAADECGIALKVATGIMPVAQSQEALGAADDAWRDCDAMALAAGHVLVSLSGSNLLALAVLRGHLQAEAAWQAAHIDEDWQISQWGEDAEAQERRERRRREFLAAAEFLRLMR